jgi:hypothetical protein
MKRVGCFVAAKMRQRVWPMLHQPAKMRQRVWPMLHQPANVHQHACVFECVQSLTTAPFLY